MNKEVKIKVVGNYSPSGHDASRIVDGDGLAPTVKENHGTVTAVLEPIKELIKKHNKTAKHQQDLLQHYEDICRCIPAGTHGSTPHLTKTVVSEAPLRIRKLTPKECFRLMGFDDRDCDVLSENGISNSQIYKMAGNSIVVDVLEELYCQLLNSYSKEL